MMSKFEQRAGHIDVTGHAGLAVRQLGRDADARIAELEASKQRHIDARRGLQGSLAAEKKSHEETGRLLAELEAERDSIRRSNYTLTQENSDLQGSIKLLDAMINNLEAEKRLLGKKVAAMEALLSESEDLYNDAPPEGYPSWEDWLSQKHLITFDYSYARSAWTFFIDREGSGQFFPDYPAALAAAKKEAQR